MSANPTGTYAGKVAFVTGAGLGIGRETAIAFAREGASVAVVDQVEDAARDVTDIITKDGGTAVAIRCDVSRGEDVRAALDKTVAAFGGLDIASTTPALSRRTSWSPISARRIGTGSSRSTFAASSSA